MELALPRPVPEWCCGEVAAVFSIYGIALDSQRDELDRRRLRCVEQDALHSRRQDCRVAVVVEVTWRLCRSENDVQRVAKAPQHLVRSVESHLGTQDRKS